jgi:hypothetical protein
MLRSFRANGVLREPCVRLAAQEFVEADQGSAGAARPPTSAATSTIFAVATIVEAYLIGRYRRSRHGSSAARCQPAFRCADHSTTAAAVRARAHRPPASSPDRSSIKHIDILPGHADVSERLAVQPRKLITLMLNLQIAADASRHQPKPRHDSDKHAKSRLKFAGHRGPRFAAGGKTRESPRPAAAGLPERRSGRRTSCVSSVRCSHTCFRQGCGAA